MEKIIKNITKIVILLFTFIILTACTPEKKFIGTWTTDIFNQGNTREDAKSIVNSLSGNNLSGNILSILMNELHFNATMEIKEDGTLVMDSGMLFNANWKKDGNKITIDGANIYGIATLSEDQNTLYFENIIDKNSKPTNGITIGSKSITFEFKRVK
ncbi:MAG: hypothetical protein E7D29_00230 [Streptococcus mitis]|nr:hypothetical protein [Streptococcus mitis]